MRASDTWCLLRIRAFPPTEDRRSSLGIVRTGRTRGRATGRIQAGLDTTEYDRLVWRPDALGSICFLVSGYLAYLEVCGRPFCRPKASPMTRNELRRAIGGER